MDKLEERLLTRKVLVSDGATGTNLHKMGLKPGTIPEELVFDDPEKLQNLATAFVNSGSDVILTCTFGGTLIRMKDSKYFDKVKEVNLRAARIARSAAASNDALLVAGSIGPTGQIMKPYGPLLPQEAFQAYAEQALALAEGGVDFFVIETMFSLEEAISAFDAVRSVSNLPIVVSFSYDRGVRTMMGVKPAVVAKTFAEKGAAAIGANCGTTLDNMEKIIKEYSTTIPGYPIWAKPNAGLPKMDENGTAVYDITPEQMAQSALNNVSSGARIVGGCCGSTPDHIAAIARAVKS